MTSQSRGYVRCPGIHVVDDVEGEGDLILAPDTVIDEQVAFLVRHTNGIACAPVTGNRAND